MPFLSKEPSNPLAIIFVIILGISASGFVYTRYLNLETEINNQQEVIIIKKNAEIKNFNECAAKGYAILESYPRQCKTPTGKTFVEEISPKEQACMNSGGSISTALCCNLTDDFPNLCLIGPCGCSPTNSHQVKVCDCGEGKCFNGESCVTTTN